MTKEQFIRLLENKKLDNPVPFQYIKGTQTWSLDDALRVKCSMSDVTGFTERPWAAQSPDGTEFALLNEAIAFLPWESWGVIFTAQRFNVTPLVHSGILTLHPDAWDEYVKNGCLTPEGIYIPRQRTLGIDDV